MAAGWFFISNHCALAIAERANPAAAHAHCHGCPAPAKQPPDGNVQCCKTLKAIVSAKINAGALALGFILKEYFPGQSALQLLQAQTQILALDTGPPVALSFSESVLQQSILAHAPPVSLS